MKIFFIFLSRRGFSSAWKGAFGLGLHWTGLAPGSTSASLLSQKCFAGHSDKSSSCLTDSVSPTVKCAIRTKMIVPKKGGRQPSATCLVLFCASETVRNKVPPRSEQSFETWQTDRGQPCSLSVRIAELGISVTLRPWAKRLKLIFISIVLKCYERTFHYVHSTGSNL